MLIRIFVLFFGLTTAQLTLGQNEGVVVLSDTVTGNQEQPKVLYIVPWQAASDDTILYQPLETRLERDVFEHLERAEHVREIGYLNKISSEPSKNE